MAGSTYSTNLKIELMATGENSGTWGDITNTNLGTALEQAIVGYGNPDFIADANLTISITNSNSAQAARALVLNVTSVFGSLTQTRNLVVPTSQKQYIVQNNTAGGQSIVVKTSAGTGITVPNGRKAHLYVDGTNVIQMFDFVDINGGAIDGTPIGAASASTGAFTTLNASGATTLDGNVTLGNASGDNVTVTGTITSNLLFTDNTYDIGASGATRPRNLFLAGAATIEGNVTLNGGTANGVAYLNGSKVLTTGSALYFNGTNLGVGTDSPVFSNSGQGVMVNGTTAGTVRVTQGGGTQAGEFRADASNVTIGSRTNGALIFEQFGSEQMRLTSTGLGIGTSSPADKLHVVGKLFLADNDPTVGGKVYGYQDSSDPTYPYSAGLKFQTRYWDGSAYVYGDRLTLTASGNLGLGVTPSAWNGSFFKTLEGGDSNNQSYVGFRTDANTLNIGTNNFFNTSNQYVYKFNGAASRFDINADNFAWSLAPSGTAGNAISFTQAMTLNANGYLSIGTTDAFGKLTIKEVTTNFEVNTDSSGGSILTYDRGANAYKQLNLRGSQFLFSVNDVEKARIDSSGNLLVGTTANTDSDRVVVNGTLGVWSSAMNVRPGAGTNFEFVNRNGAGFRWYVNSAATLAASIDSSGNLLVGTTDSNNEADAGARLFPSGAIASTRTQSANTDFSYTLYSTGASAYRFYVGMGGTIYATSTTITAISDRRLKENIQDIDVGLNAVMALKPRKFDWKAGKGKDKKGDRGWIAQEFEQVFPEMIDTWADPAPEGEEPYKAVNADLIPVLVKAIQELKAEFDAYKATHP